MMIYSLFYLKYNMVPTMVFKCRTLVGKTEHAYFQLFWASNKKKHD